MRAALCLLLAAYPTTSGCGFIGRTFGSDDPPKVDAPPLPGDSPVDVRFVQTNDDAISGTTWSCSAMGTGYTLPNTYYRVFDLAAANVTRPMTVLRVRYGIQRAIAPLTAGHQSITVGLGTYAGTAGGAALDASLITPLDSQQVDLVDGTNETINTVFDTPVAAGALLVATLDIADGQADHKTLLVATNGDGETAHSYWKAPAGGCDVPDPVWIDDYASAHSAPKQDVILEVYGVY